MSKNDTILIITRSQETAAELKSALAGLGGEVKTAPGGREALALQRSHEIPVVISETGLPGWDGATLLKGLKEQEPQTEVIFLVEPYELEEAYKLLRLGASDFVVKPISRTALEAVLLRAGQKVAFSRTQQRFHTSYKDLISHRERCEQLFDEVPCYISVQDRDLRLTATNRRFKEDFGDELGEYCYCVYKHRDEPCDVCPVAMTFEDGKPHQTEEMVTSKHGDQYHVLTWTAPLYDENGHLDQVMEMSTNITEIRRLQDQLSNLGILIGSMSHGIKGLLTGLDGGMYLLDSGFNKGNEERIKEGWEIVKLIAGRIREMVLNLLFYAKERQLEWEEVEVLAFAQDLAKTVETKSQAQNVELICEYDDSLGKFEIDQTLLRDAIINILENALDACALDKSKDEHQIVFRVGRDNGDIVFGIDDNGLGMDEETKNNMFSLFFSSKGADGTGLGLFITNKIIQQHGGKIWVESQVGQGSNFKIKIPKELPDSAKNGVSTTEELLKDSAVA